MIKMTKGLIEYFQNDIKIFHKTFFFLSQFKDINFGY